MIKRTLKPSDYFLIAANLWPVIGAWFWGWNAKEVFVVYCLETIIIGVFNLIKMGIITLVRKTDTWYNGESKSQVSGIVFMLFFLAHYGMFVAIQTGLFIQVSGMNKDLHAGFFDFFLHWPRYLSADSYSILAGFVIGYGAKLVLDFLANGEYKRISLMRQMFQPYLRIFIQQVTVILGSMFLVFGAGKIFILIFAVVKILFEIFVDYEGLLKSGMQKAEEEAERKKSMTRRQ
jgi:hypothetical protein